MAEVYGIDEMLQDPHMIHRKMSQVVGEVDGEPIRQIGIGPKLSETPGSVRRLGPLAGEHTAEVLAEIGYQQSEIDALTESGAVG